MINPSDSYKIDPDEFAAIDSKFNPSGIEGALKLLSIKIKDNPRRVQFHALGDDQLWTEAEVDVRLFAATRLLYNYCSGAGVHVSGRIERIETLKDLILRLAETKAELMKIPVVIKIRRKKIRIERHSKSDQAALYS